MFVSHLKYNKAFCLYVYIYMSAIASQMAGPNGLNIFEGTLEYPGGKIGRKNLNYFFSFSKFHGQRRSLQLVLLNKYVCMTPEIFENVDCIIVGIHREIFISDNSKQIIIKSNQISTEADYRGA